VPTINNNNNNYNYNYNVITIIIIVIIHADGSRENRILTEVCLSVCLFIRMLSEKQMQLESSNLTHCSTMSPENPFILGSKGQMSSSRVTKTILAKVIAVL